MKTVLKTLAVLFVGLPLWYLAWAKWDERQVLDAWVEWRTMLAKYPNTFSNPREIDKKSPAEAARFDALEEKYRRRWHALGYDRD